MSRSILSRLLCGYSEIRQRLWKPYFCSLMPVNETDNNIVLTSCYRNHASFSHKPGHNFSTRSTSSSTELPEQIERQCREWEEILRIEQEAAMRKYKWMGYKLGFQNVLPNMSTSKLILHTDNLTPGQRKTLRTHYIPNTPVEIRPIGNYEDLNLTGVIRKYFDNVGFVFMVDRRINPAEEGRLKECTFDIRRSVGHKEFEHKLKFLAKRSQEWRKMAGYQNIEIAFKCRPLPEHGPDPVDSIRKEMNFDTSQQKTLSAALNMERPIVAIHGPPGSGKTRLLAECLNMLAKQGKRVLVISKSPAGLYNLVGEYAKMASDHGNFHFLRDFDEKLASKIIRDSAILKLIERRSFYKMPTYYHDKQTLEIYQKTMAVQKGIELAEEKGEEKSGYSKEMVEEAEQLTHQGREWAHELTDVIQKKFIGEQQIIFSTQSRSTINMFMRNGITFDVVVMDDADGSNELETWWIASHSAPVIRLFGDYNRPGTIVRSQIARENAFRKSLLQRLDEQFGPEVNMHLGRQYRSNPAIQEWPNRVFYRERAAEPDESVKNISLNDLVEEGKNPRNLIADPFVLIDLGQLEGEWREWMFKEENGGKSWHNWGEALLVVTHLCRLFENVPLCQPHQMAYFTLYEAQRNKIKNIFSALFPRQLQKCRALRIENSQTLYGQQVDVVLQSHVTPPHQNIMVDPFHLKHLAFDMTRARRQFIYLAKSEWLEKGSPESRQLLDTFREKGRIVGPNELLPLETGQFEKMKMDVEEWGRRQPKPTWNGGPNRKY